MTKKIYIAMAEFEDGNKVFERAYITQEAARRATEAMIADIEAGAGLGNLIPSVEEIDLIDE